MTHHHPPRRKARTLVLGASVLAAATALAACSSSGSSTASGSGGSNSSSGTSGSSSGKHYTIGLASEGLSTVFAAQMVAGAKKEAAKLGDKLTVLDGKYSASTQSGDVQDLIAEHVDGVILDPVVAGPAGNMVKQLTAAHIPVVLMHTPAGSDSDPTAVDAGVAAEVAENEALAGSEAAKLGQEAVPSGGQVAIILGAPGTAQAKQRTSGFTDAIGSKFHVVAQQTGNWTPQGGQTACQNMLQSHPQVTLVYSESDDMTTGCLHAMQSAGSTAKVVSIGGETSVRAQIQQGTVYGTICFEPVTEGQQALQTLHGVIAKSLSYNGKFLTYPLTPVTSKNISACGWQWS